MLKRFWKSARRAIGSPRAQSVRKEPRWETLEPRQMLSTAGVDYSLTGYSWADPSKITYSLPADATTWDAGVNDMNAKLTAAYGGTSWKRDVAKALQTWASVANINVVPVADSSAPFNVWGKSQGDPRFGDVRVGGYAFPNDLTTLAQTYFPPPNGSTGAGDVELNTGFNWAPGQSYDLYSVLLHETGHSLGLDHAKVPADVMYASYGGVRTSLGAGDIAGIQAIYGPRTADAYQSRGVATSFTSALDLTGNLDGYASAAAPNVSLATIGDTEYFSVVAPAGASGSMLEAAAIVAGISSLSPKITVYDASMHPLASEGNASAWSVDAGVGVPNIQAGQRYYLAVTGATNDVFSVGAYQLKLLFTGISPPAVQPPVAQPPIVQAPAAPPPVAQPPVVQTPVSPPPAPVVPTIPQDRFGSNDQLDQPINLGYVNQAAVGGLSLTSASDYDLFTFQSARAGTVSVGGGSTLIRVVSQYGQIVAAGVGSVSFQATRPGARFFVIVTSATGAGVADYSLEVSVQGQSGRVVRRREVVAASTPSPIASDADVASPSPSSRNPAQAARVRRWGHHRVEVIAPNWMRRGR